MGKKICLVTLVDSIEATSMPTNEFVIYRESCNFAIRQVMIVCSANEMNGVKIPETVSVYFVQHNLNKIRTVVKDTIVECKKNGEKVVFHLHAQTSSLLFFLSTIGLEVRKRSIFTIHSLCSARNIKYRIGSYLCSLLSSYITCISSSVYNDYWSLIRKIKGNRVKIMLNSIDFSRLDNAINDDPNHIEICNMMNIVCVDRMIPLKNQQFLIKLMKYIPNTNLLLIGDGELKDELEKLAKTEGVDNRVIFLGLLSREQVYREINKCGLYVSASKIEGFHNSVLEAMGVGAIPIVSDIPAHREIASIIGKVTPLPFDYLIWSNKIKEYQNMDKLEIEKISKYLKKRVKVEFSLFRMHEQFNHVYEILAF